MTDLVQADRLRPALGWLDAAVVAGCAVTAGAVAGSDPRGFGVAAVVLIVVLVGWFLLGRRTENGGRGWLPFLLVIVAGCVVGAGATPAFATFQVVAFPLAWMLTPGFRTGIVLNVAIALAIGAGYAAAAGPFAAIAVEGVSFGFSVAMGAWITRIEHRSAERQALVDQLTAAQEQVAALNRESGTVAERERLAREVHDTLAQSLAGVVMLAERARGRYPADPGLGVLEDAARQALSEARALVTGAASVPMEGGLVAALGVLAERFRRETGLAVTVEVRADVPRGLEVVLLRCAQEGLSNVRKHAGADSVAIGVVEADGAATMTVTDDGSGPGDGSGFGIAGMRDRLALVGGDVSLAARPDGGAALTIRVPLPDPVAS